MRERLAEWNQVLTRRATELERELSQFEALRATWSVSRTEAVKSGAPAPVLDRITVTLAAIVAARDTVGDWRASVQAYGEIHGLGSVTDFAGLKITSDEANALAAAKAGDALNLSAGEIAAFQAARSTGREAIERQLHAMLVARHRAYRARGLAGMAAYDRGGGRTSDPATDLRKASEDATGLKRYLPQFQAVLLGYPKAAISMQESFFWVRSIIHGRPTYILAHVMNRRRLYEPRLHRPDHRVRRVVETEHRRQRDGAPARRDLRSRTDEGRSVRVAVKISVGRATANAAAAHPRWTQPGPRPTAMPGSRRFRTERTYRADTRLRAERARAGTWSWTPWCCTG
jgi:hypothetical protein